MEAKNSRQVDCILRNRNGPETNRRYLNVVFLNAKATVFGPAKALFSN